MAIRVVDTDVWSYIYKAATKADSTNHISSVTSW